MSLIKLVLGVISMKSRKELEAKLLELKSDYVRIQSDLEKLAFVRGNEKSAEDVLVQLEKEIAEINEQLSKTE